MKRIFYFLILILILTACSDKKNITINGTLKGLKGKTIYLKRVDVDIPVLIDSSLIDKNGKFRFRLKSKETDFYQLGASSTDYITLLAEPGEDIRLSFNGKYLSENYIVSGSKGSEKIRSLDLSLIEAQRRLDSLRTEYNKASKEPGFETKGPELETEFNNLLKDQRMKNIAFILNNTSSLASIKALYQKITPDMYVLYEPRDLQYQKILADSLSRHYPHSKSVKSLTLDLEKGLSRIYTSQLEQMTKDIPETKLNPDLLNTEGKRISLASLKGNYVLVTFWSVNSSSCIAENLQLKEFYKLYHKKGFEIYQISIDQDEDLWKKEVRFDELPWISTREYDPDKPKYARLFNVSTIPANYLFDKNGQLIGFDLHDRTLQLKLEQLFN
jgi:hypothetical protein